VVDQTDIAAYIGQYVHLQREGRELVALCPFHKEKSPSFHVQVEKRLWNCFGCSTGGNVIQFAQKFHGMPFPEALLAVAQFSGVSEPLDTAPVDSGPATVNVARKHTATYYYHGPDGAELFQVWRYEPGRNGRKKDFSQCYQDPETGEMVWQKYPDPVLYRLPAVIAADEVWLVEGEKDAETIERLGFVGTTSPGGSNAAFTVPMIESLAGKSVFLIPDADEPGEKRGRQLQALLAGKCSLTVFRVQQGKDITEWVEAAGDDAVVAAMEAVREYAKRDRLRGLLTVEQIIDRSGIGYDAFCDVSKRPKGVSTGFVKLDTLTLGLFPGQLVVVAGRPAMGKTALAMNIAVNVAKAGFPVNVFSLEMSSDELLTRMACSEARVSGSKFRLGYINAQERRAIGAELGNLNQIPLLIDDHAGASAEYIHESIKRTAPGLVVIDYLGLMSAKKAENRVQQVSAITRGLKLMAKEMRCPVLLVAQVSRAAETRASGSNVPQLSDLRESGSIEQDADMVWFVYRPEYYKPDRDDLKGLAEVIIAKQRNGPVGKVRLAWIGECTRFDNLAENGGLREC